LDSYAKTLERIFNLRGGEIDLRLDRMERALALFGHPEKQFPSFHIAGTNGKGSTAAILHRVLSLAGYRTALYTSPHLNSFTERMRIGAGEITADEVVALAAEIDRRTAAAAIPLTFFEYITVMAFIHFARREVEVAVVEVGLGGRLDATNLVSPVVCAVTTISKDHEAYLGSDLRSIAREKAGIIKPGIPVVLGALTDEVTALFRLVAEERGSTPYFLGQDFRISLKIGGAFDYTGIKQNLTALSLALRGRHQRNNAAVALAALEMAQPFFPVREQHVRDGLRSVSWPGRFEIIEGTPTVILDGAHNGEGVRALADALEEYRGTRKVKLLFACMEDKDWRLMLSMLVPLADEMVLTRVQMDRSADPRDLAAEIADQAPHRIIDDSRTAIKFLIDHAAPQDLVVVAGSLYLLGEVRGVVRSVVG
jgi:dihydrofolate synthase/folylpolyglutamate synthase